MSEAQTIWLETPLEIDAYEAGYQDAIEAQAAEIEQIVDALLAASVEPSPPKEDHKSGWDDYRAAVYDAHLAKEDEKRQP